MFVAWPGLCDHLHDSIDCSYHGSVKQHREDTASRDGLRSDPLVGTSTSLLSKLHDLVILPEAEIHVRKSRSVQSLYEYAMLIPHYAVWFHMHMHHKSWCMTWSVFRRTGDIVWWYTWPRLVTFLPEHRLNYKCSARFVPRKIRLD